MSPLFLIYIGLIALNSVRAIHLGSSSGWSQAIDRSVFQGLALVAASLWGQA